MHPLAQYRWDDRRACLAFVEETVFGNVFLQTPQGPRVAHVPLFVEGERLRFHLANGNALTAHLDGATALASVTGANAYVSPNWYVNRRRVPTWNYVAVECEGPVRNLSPDELVALLDVSAARQEPRVGENWTRAKMEPARFEAMCRAITGFELDATTIRATRKLSQDSNAADLGGAVEGVAATGDPAVAALMCSTRP